MAAPPPTSVPTTLTTKNQPFPASSSSASSSLSGSSSGSGSITSSVPITTSFPTLTPSGNGTTNTTTATFAWDCERSTNAAKESVFVNFSGCTYASATPTAKPANGTSNGTLPGAPPPTTGAGMRSASGMEMGSFAALGLVLVAMMGWL